jgi:transglutaminase-like putative cysteine protease/tetratricopeptide (TPR) repeat protein
MALSEIFMRSPSLVRSARFALPAAVLSIALPALAAPPAPSMPAPSASPWSGAAFATPPAALLAAAKALPQPTDQQVDFLLFEARLTLEADGLWSERQHQIYRVLDASAVDDWAYVEQAWSPWHQLRPELSARVIGLDGTERRLDPKTISEASAGEDSAIMFDDGKVLRAPLPAVEAGAIVEIETYVRDQRPLFAAGSVRRLTFPSDHLRVARVDVDAAASAPLQWVRRLLPETGPVERTEGGRRRLHFEWRDLAFKNKFVIGLPSDAPWYPYLAFSSGASWQSVAATYSQVVDKALAGADVRAAVEKASEGATDQTQVIDRLLAYLQGQVRYTGVEFDDAAIVPRSPSETLARRFGDCKDKAALLVALLRAADIPAYLALLSGGWGSDVDPELPGLGNFNHAIVYVPATPPIWIDATEELARAGELPSSDRDRWALVAAPGTKALQKTPPPVAAQNLLSRTRTVTLAELGKAKIVEENVFHGDVEIWARRNLGQADEKTRKDWITNYSKSHYLTDQIGPYQMAGATDLSQPFRTRWEIPASPRGSTDLNEAAVGIRLESLIERLPYPFLHADAKGSGDDAGDAEGEDSAEETGDEPTAAPAADPQGDGNEAPAETAATPDDDKAPKRTQPFVFRDPFVTEWRYEIQPPPGFAVREIPESKVEAFGTASLERRYRSLPGGALEAYYRFDSGKVRLSPEEFEALREKTIALSQGEPILLYFDQVGAAALNQGKVSEALAEFRRLAAAAPDRALYPLQISRALLAGGLQEAAKAEAERAVAMSPKLAAAQQNLGWVLQHDPLGRLRGAGGFDLAGSVAAYKKAVALDPDNDIAKADLAILLDFNAKGEQFGKGADLEAAGKLYRELRDKGITGLDVNLMSNLLQRGKLDELKKFTSKADASAAQQQYLAAALALLDGPDAASRLARGVADNDQRVAMLSLAGQQLLKSRRYAEAGKLFQILASVSREGAAALGTMQKIASARRWEELELPARAPATLMVRLLMLALQNKLSADEMKGYLSHRLLSAEVDEEVKQFEAKTFLDSFSQGSADGDSNLIQLGLDMAVNLLHSDVVGDDELGYRVRSRLEGFPNTPSFTLFILREDGQYRLFSDNKDWQPVARLVLELAAAGKLDGARHWLDWARDEIEDDDSSDPYARPPFVRLWTAGQQGDLAEIRAAASVLLLQSDDTDVGPALRASLEEGLQGIAALRPAATGDTAVALDLATWDALATLKRWSDLIPLLERLADAQPGSERALRALFYADQQSGHPENITPRLEARLAKTPNDPFAVRMLADLADSEGDISRSLTLTRTLVDRGKADALDWNRLAWNQLFEPPIPEKTLADASRASEMTDHSSRAILHTLASVYAELERPAEAYRILLQSIDAGDHKPSTSDWYVLGRMAESYGLPDQARAYYARIEKPDQFVTVSVFTLAQRRLAAMGPEKGKAGKVAAKKAKA